MKANQAFKANDEAVSPVIGVILMVAITVVLAAVVFVLVTKLSNNNSSSAPTMSISVDDVNDRLVVTSASTGADWSRISVKLSSCTQGVASSVINLGVATPYQGDDATTAGADLNTAASSGTACGAGLTVAVTSASAIITANDFLDFCVGPVMGGA